MLWQIKLHMNKRMYVHAFKNKLVMILLSILQIFDMTDGGLHVVSGFVVEGELGGVVVGAVSQGPVRSAVGEGTGFAVR